MVLISCVALRASAKVAGDANTAALSDTTKKVSRDTTKKAKAALANKTGDRHIRLVAPASAIKVKKDKKDTSK